MQSNSWTLDSDSKTIGVQETLKIHMTSSVSNHYSKNVQHNENMTEEKETLIERDNNPKNKNLEINKLKHNF